MPLCSRRHFNLGERTTGQQRKKVSAYSTGGNTIWTSIPQVPSAGPSIKLQKVPRNVWLKSLDPISLGTNLSLWLTAGIQLSNLSSYNNQRKEQRKKDPCHSVEALLEDQLPLILCLGWKGHLQHQSLLWSKNLPNLLKGPGVLVKAVPAAVTIIQS